jgi:hypothetical protein
MKFENADVWGFKHAVRGMRNPLNSWAKGDSGYAVKEYELHDGEEKVTYDESQFGIGPNDIDLMQRLIKGGSEHRKFMRQIMVSVDITAPMYWWSEFDTYKIGTTANSTSKMHKLASKPITIEDFEMDDHERVKVFDREPYNPDDYTDEIWEFIIDACEALRLRYIETKNRKYWKELIRILPESYLQTRTVTMNYENLYSIVRQRKGHKLTEWRQFINWAETLPYAKELLFYEYN